MIGQIRRDAEPQQVHSLSGHYNERYIFDFEKLGTQSQHADRTYVIELRVRNKTNFDLLAAAVGI